MISSRLLPALALSALAVAGFAAPASAGDDVATATNKISIYELPDYQGRILGLLQAGEEVRLDRCNAQGTWCRVFHDGPTGWVLASFLIGARAKIDATPGRSITAPPLIDDSKTRRSDTFW
jgi:uncharacterized protein YraI